jgi:hypothetical protein
MNQDPSALPGPDPERQENRKSLQEQLSETAARYEDAVEQLMRRDLGEDLYPLISGAEEAGEDALSELSDEEITRYISDQVHSDKESLLEGARMTASRAIAVKLGEVNGYALYDANSEANTIEFRKHLTDHDVDEHDFTGGRDILEIYPKGDGVGIRRFLVGFHPSTEEGGREPSKFGSHDKIPYDLGDDSDPKVQAGITAILDQLNAAIADKLGQLKSE